MAKINAISSASKANQFPTGNTKEPLTNPLQFRKIPPQPKSPEAPLATPSVLTLIQSGGGGSHRTGIKFGAGF